MTRKIWFIRHAESMTNSGESWDRPDTNPLTENGHKQARLVCGALTEKPSLIVTSPYIRTLETAKPALNRWPDVSHEEWPIHEFAPFCHIKHGGVTGPLWRDHTIDIWKRGDPDYKDGETAESFNDLVKRVDEAVERIIALEDEKTLVFSHGFFLGVLFYRLENRAPANCTLIDIQNSWKNIHIPNTSISYFTLDKDGRSQYHTTSVNHLSKTEQNSIGY